MGSPVKAANLSRKRKLNDDFFSDPRPEHLRNKAGYPDRHDYLERPFTEYWVEQAVDVTADEMFAIKERTRGQASSKNWFKERSWRITASRFGDICLATDRRNKQKLCESIHQPSAALLRSEALIHGRTYEARAKRNFERETGRSVRRCGLLLIKKDLTWVHHQMALLGTKHL
ncbi:uncharacterized protein LOC134265503 [Saccostrea cucullata]|uniref:uncharacterized protein LOC134265503 n=1 Tax=Saccostrea cuccullata TaxID=36930 RepID=UPI002ED36C86